MFVNVVENIAKWRSTKMSDFNLSSKILRDGDGYPCIRPQHAKEFIRLLKEDFERDIMFKEIRKYLLDQIDKRAGEELI